VHRGLRSFWAGVFIYGTCTAALTAQAPAAVAAALDSAHWTLNGRAEFVDHQGRRSLMLDGGEADLNGMVFRDGVIDFDVSASAARGFFGIIFRTDSANGEYIYLRPHKSGHPDAIQYTPVLNTGLNWQLYSGPGFTAPVNIPRDTWFHVRIEVTGARARLFVGDTAAPALVMDDLKSGVQKGGIAIAVLQGDTYFSNVTVRATDDAPWIRHLPAMPQGAVIKWRISESLDALARNLEQPLTPSELKALTWVEVDAEAPGLVPLNRYRPSPHPRVTFQTDFATHLKPQPGTRVVYARTTIVSDRDQVRKLELGYSDEVTVFLNGTPLYRGRSAQSFRDPEFLGIMSADNDAIYVPLRKGNNELILAVSELGGGWGFAARLVDVPR